MAGFFATRSETKRIWNAQSKRFSASIEWYACQERRLPHSSSPSMSCGNFGMTWQMRPNAALSFLFSPSSVYAEIHIKTYARKENKRNASADIPKEKNEIKRKYLRIVISSGKRMMKMTIQKKSFACKMTLPINWCPCHFGVSTWCISLL